MKCCIAIFTSCRNLPHEYKNFNILLFESMAGEMALRKELQRVVYEECSATVRDVQKGQHGSHCQMIQAPPFFYMYLVNTPSTWKRGDDSVVQSRLPPFWCCLPFLPISWKLTSNLLWVSWLIFMIISRGLNFLQKTGLF